MLAEANWHRLCTTTKFPDADAPNTLRPRVNTKEASLLFLSHSLSRVSRQSQLLNFHLALLLKIIPSMIDGERLGVVCSSVGTQNNPQQERIPLN